MPALIDDDLVLFGGKGDWETDPQLTIDPAGFDSVKAVLCYRGTAAQLLSVYDLGTKNAPGFTDKPLYYTGPRVLESRFGYQIAELTWMGFASDPWNAPSVQGLVDGSFVRSMNITMTTEESLWPREGHDGNTIFLGGPYAPPASFGATRGLRTFTAMAPNGNTIVTAQLPWRIRLIGRAWTVSMTGISAGERTVIVRPPRCTVPNPNTTSGGQTAINWLDTGDPLVSWSDETGGVSGWVCRNYDLTSELPLGSKILARWSAHYQWVERYGP
jgi:hypothetical protein